DDSKYLREEFTDGKELVFFSLEERGKLADRVRSLLAHQEDVMEIAENGYRKAVLQHTWKQRTAVLVKELKVL
ncbi:MAG: glycosyltransferase, partial [Clostridiales bacterium]|nr:glycosyltransferase [Clostridiales bacterium]